MIKYQYHFMPPSNNHRKVSALKYILCILLIILCIVLFRVLEKATHFLQTFKQILAYNNKEQQVKPKSLSSATSIYLPLIEDDFPDFNYFEFKNIVKNTLLSTFLVLDTQDIHNLIQCSQKFKETISLELEDNENSGTSPHYEQIDLHQTEISNYIKRDGRCIITLQSSVGYYHWVEKDNEMIEGSKTIKKQTRYYTDLVYVQNEELAQNIGAEFLGNNCPNCGGAISNLGEKYCAYCGTSLIAINIKVWSLDSYHESP